MADGTVPDCLTSQTVSEQAKNGLSDLFIAYSVSSPFGAGIETVSSSHTRSHFGSSSAMCRLQERLASCSVGVLLGFPTVLLIQRSVAMLHYPDVMRKAQAEVDSVVGQDRLPDWRDSDKLPYINALINETLRWRPIAVLGGTPHAVTTDDEYQGMWVQTCVAMYNHTQHSTP